LMATAVDLIYSGHRAPDILLVTSVQYSIERG